MTGWWKLAELQKQTLTERRNKKTTNKGKMANTWGETTRTRWDGLRQEQETKTDENSNNTALIQKSKSTEKNKQTLNLINSKQTTKKLPNFTDLNNFTHENYKPHESAMKM